MSPYPLKLINYISLRNELKGAARKEIVVKENKGENREMK